MKGRAKNRDGKQETEGDQERQREQFDDTELWTEHDDFKTTGELLKKNKKKQPSQTPVTYDVLSL